MTDLDYRVHTSKRKKLTQEPGPAGVLDRFKDFRTETDSPYFIVRDDGTQGSPRDGDKIRERLVALVPALKGGQRLRVVSDDAQAFFIHSVEVAPPMANVPGVPNVKAWVAILHDKWPNARLAGTCVCKDDSTSHCNGHNDCAACDDFDTDANMVEQRDYLIEHAEPMGVSYVILHDRIWTFGPPRSSSSRASRYYTGTYHYHVHASFTGGTCGIACRPSSNWP